MDTGAAVSLLSRALWERVKPDGAELQPGISRQLVSVDGTPLQICGSAVVPVQLADRTYDINIVVAEGLTTEAILGLDFLEAHLCILDLGRRTLSFDGCNTIPFRAAPTNKPTIPLKVSLVESICIPATSELEIMAHVSGLQGSQACLLEQAQYKRLPVRVARALVTPTVGGVPVRLLNPAPHQVTIYKDTTIAIMEPVDSLSICSIPTESTSSTSIASPAVNVPQQTRERLTHLAFSKSNTLSSTQSEQLFALLMSYGDIFAENADDVGRTKHTEHRIDTGTNPPIRQTPRRIPAARKEKAHILLQDMLRKGTIRPSKSPWSSPIVLVQKKNGSLRFCVDYRKLNAVTRKDAYPLPRVDDTLDTLAGAQWFTTLDLISGYWQVEVKEDDREKTAFSTPDGLFEFNVMPFGLCNAPATFQRLMDAVFAGVQWNSCLVYLDDIIILGRTFEEHLCNLHHVFSRLREAGLKLQPAKCTFCQKEVTFLGHIVSPSGVAPDPSKTDKVTSWPTPACKRDVQQFIGLANYYRRFIRNFASIARPLHRLTEKTASFKWTSECQTAFDSLKLKLTSAPVLAHPDGKYPFLLDTDASGSGIGAVLSQTYPDGTEKVIAYASRALTKTERRYCVTRRELLAIVHFVRHFRSYLLGRPFTLLTDHGSLTWLHNFKEPEGQLARWLARLQEYDFTITHRRGQSHGNADALSRRPCKQCGRSCPQPAFLEHKASSPLTVKSQDMPVSPITSIQQLTPISREWQLKDGAIGPVLKAVQAGEKIDDDTLRSLSRECRQLHQQWELLRVKHGKLWRLFVKPSVSTQHLQLIVPQSLRHQILTELHDSPTGGHLGEDKLYSRLQQRFYWPGYSTDVKHWCATCPSCTARKSPTTHNQAPLQTVAAGSPMQIVAVDILGPLPESPSKNRYVLVAMDYFTRWTEAYAIPNQEAITIATKLVNEMFLRFSVPEQLHSDQGRQFESRLMTEICSVLGIHKTHTTPYHPQSDGLVERFNRTLLSMLST